MRTVFMGSPEEVVEPLKYILSNIKELEVVAVISQPARKVGRGKKLADPPLAAFAKEAGIPTLQPEKASSDDFLSSFRDLDPDLVITAAYGQILSDEFLKIPKRGTINIHPSLLPIYRGATPVQTALLNGDKETAVSILFTVKKMDAGNIICQKSFAIEDDETTQSLLPRLFKESGPMLNQAVELLNDPSFTGNAQNENDVVHCKKIQKEDGFISFKEEAEVIYNKYRGLTPWPGTYGYIAELRVSFEKMVPLETSDLSPGEFKFLKPLKLIAVGTSKGDIGISILKPAGKKSIDAPSFWNGLKDKSNTKFSESEPNG